MGSQKASQAKRLTPIPPKLTDDEAADLLKRYSEEGWHEWELAERFNLAIKTVQAIVRGWSYKQVKGGRAPRKTGFVTLEKAMLVCRLRGMHWNLERIAARVELGLTSVKRILSGQRHWSPLWAKRNRAKRRAKAKVKANEQQHTPASN